MLRPCAGASYGPPTIQVTSSDTCGNNSSFPLNLVTATAPGGAICSSTSSNCNGGSAWAYQTVIFEGITVFPRTCGKYSLSFSPTCCTPVMRNYRGGQITIYSDMYPLQDSTNSSVYYSDQSAYNLLVGVQNKIQLGAIDPDGDSLSYRFVCLKSLNSCLNLNNGYSHTRQIPGIQIDATTGEITVTPAITGLFGIGILVSEYNASGQLIAENYRMTQFRSIVSANSPPNDSLGISNYQGDGYHQGRDIYVCADDSFSFDFVIWDDIVLSGDSTDTLIITSNLDSILEGGTLSINPINDSVHIATVAWRAKNTTALTQDLTFMIKSSDDHCPHPGVKSSLFTIHVRPGSYIKNGVSAFICRGIKDSVRLEAIAQDSLRWQVLSGSPLQQGINFSCDTCKVAYAFPTSTTTYTLLDLKGSRCSNSDTITISVSDSFNIITIQDTSICEGDTINNFPLQISRNGNFDYSWSNASYISNDTTKNPDISIAISTDVQVRVSENNCTNFASSSLSVITSPKKTTEIISDPFCRGTGTSLEVELRSKCSNCGAHSLNCNAAKQMQIVQLGNTDDTTNTNGGSGPNNYPNPFASIHDNSRMQFLYRASELSSKSFHSGLITEIGFHLLSLPHGVSSASLQNYTIKMGCTADTNLIVWDTCTLVKKPFSLDLKPGWIMIKLDSAFYLPDSLNLVVELCFESNLSGATQVRRDTTSFFSSLSNYQNTVPICSVLSYNWSNLQARPEIILKYGTTYDTSAYTVSWHPQNKFSQVNSFKTNLSLSNTDSIYAVVRDTSGCFIDTLYKTIKALNNATVSIDSIPGVCRGVDSIPLNQGRPVGGTFSGPGVNSSNYFFPDSITPTDSAIVQYTYVDSNGCSETASKIIQLYQKTKVSLDSPQDLCLQDGPIPLSKGKPTGGTYSGQGVDTGYFHPEMSHVGNMMDITYTYIDSNRCANSAQDTLEVFSQAPQINVGGPDTVYKDSTGSFYIQIQAGSNYNWLAPNGTLILISNDSARISWSDTGVYQIEVVETVGNVCETSSFKEVTVIESPDSEPSAVHPNLGTISFRVFPNPVKDQLEIQHSKKEYFSVRITNSLGQLFFEGKALKSLSVNTSNWSTGAYQITLYSKEGHFIERVIK